MSGLYTEYKCRFFDNLYKKILNNRFVLNLYFNFIAVRSNVIFNNSLFFRIRYGFIVVNKKINTRFFLKEGNTYSNPPHGSIVDNTITRYDR